MANADQFLRMVSGPAGGSWYPLGAKIMQTMQAEIKGLQPQIRLAVEFQMFFQ